MTIRPLALSDLDLVCDQRECMFREMGHGEDALAAMRGPFRDWLRPRLDGGTYLGFVAEAEGQAVGGVGVLILDWPPHASQPEMNLRGYVLNVYVDPPFRRRGIARQLMEKAEEALRGRGIHHVSLHAADAARPLYEGAGWTATPEMSKAL